MKLTQMRHATFYRFSMYNTEMCHHWCISSREWWNANFWRSILRIHPDLHFWFSWHSYNILSPFPKCSRLTFKSNCQPIYKMIESMFPKLRFQFHQYFYFSKCHAAINHLTPHFRKLTPGALHSLYPRPSSELLLFPSKIWDQSPNTEHVVQLNAEGSIW